jgi:hypothetical protein
MLRLLLGSLLWEDIEWDLITLHGWDARMGCPDGMTLEWNGLLLFVLSQNWKPQKG